MARYKVELKGLTALATDYPHSPEDYTASMNDYLEAKFAVGWKFVAVLDDGGDPRWFFKANAQ
jgi:hypothetical protein